jgi:histidine kinase/DNA gyrase B/HSP90-like ATPase
MTNAATLKVTSHVGRDILASAAHFKTEAAVVWEYVANSLQYVDPGTPPKVQVFVKQKEKQIEVRDNGRGMDETDLQHFFTMHGENLERRAGRRGRGKFGTGKSAAFGIASSLRVDTRRNGFRNVAQLSRNSIDRSNGRDVPVEVIAHNEATGYGNGTTISITELLLDRINTPSIIEYIERHLSAFRYLHPEVAVNNYLCGSREITVAKMRTFRPSPEQSRIIGDVELVIKVAQAPLNEDDQGIVITAGPGNLVAKESAGIEKKEFGNYLFGETDIIALETSESLIEPYDSTRSLQLNPKHPVAVVLLSFRFETRRNEARTRSSG